MAGAIIVPANDAADPALAVEAAGRSLFNLLTASDTVIADASDYLLALAQAMTSRYALLARDPRAADGRLLPIDTGMVADIGLLGEKRSVASHLLTPITRLRESELREWDAS